MFMRVLRFNKHKMTIQEWFRDGVQYDSEGTQIWAEERTKDAVYLHHVADIRGWGEMQNIPC